MNDILTIDLDPKLYKKRIFFWEVINDNFIRKMFIPVIHFFVLLVLCHVLKNFEEDYICPHQIYLLLIDLVILVHIFYEIALVNKVKIIYKYALNGKWMIPFDVIYIIVNLVHLFLTVVCGCYYSKIPTVKKYVKLCFLNLYKGVPIEEYELNKEFIEYSEKDKYEYLSRKVNNFKISNSYNDMNLINNINDYRLRKNLNKFNIDNKIPDFIIKGSTEMLLSAKNIIKLSNIKYVLKFNENIINFDVLQ